MPSYQISPPFYGYVSNRGPQSGPWVIGSNIYVLLDNALLDPSYPTTVVTMMRSADGGATWTSIPLSYSRARCDLSQTTNPYFDSTNNLLYLGAVYRPSTGLETTGERRRLFLTLFNFNSETWTEEYSDPTSGPEFLDKITSTSVNDYPYYRWTSAIYTDSSDIHVFFCADRNTYDYSQVYWTKYNGVSWATNTLIASDDLKNCVPWSVVKHSDGYLYLQYTKSGETTSSVTGRSFHLAIVDTAGAVIGSNDITTEVSIYSLVQTSEFKLNNGKIYFVTPTYTTFTASDGNPHSMLSLYFGTAGTGITWTRYDIAFHINPNDSGGNQYATWTFESVNAGAGAIDVTYDGSNYTIYFTHMIQYQVADPYRPNQSGVIYKVVTDAVSSDTITNLFTGTSGPDVSYVITAPKPFTYSSQNWLFFIYGYITGYSTALGTSPYNGYYNQQTWITQLITADPALNFADTLTMYDAATVTRRDTLNFPVITVPICPDLVVNSGACTFVKTIDDDDPILTDCEETIYSEPGGSCE